MAVDSLLCTRHYVYTSINMKQPRARARAAASHAVCICTSASFRHVHRIQHPQQSYIFISRVAMAVYMMCTIQIYSSGMAYVPPNRRGSTGGSSMPPPGPPRDSDSFRYGGVRGDSYSRCARQQRPTPDTYLTGCPAPAAATALAAATRAATTSPPCTAPPSQPAFPSGSRANASRP